MELSPELVNKLKDLGLTGIVIFALIGSYFKLWYWRHHLEQIIKDHTEEKVQWELRFSDCNKQIEQLRTERNFWIEQDRKNIGIVNDALLIGAKLTQALERVRGT